MGKRSNFERKEKDFYPTPYEAVLPLFPYLKPLTTFSEPCSGEGDLVNHLSAHRLICVYSSDISEGNDARDYKTKGEDYIITNPPWSRPILHELILHFSSQRPTWLLFDADWMHTKQAYPYLKFCRKILSVGRVKWIPDSPYVGKDNACWYLFDDDEYGTTEFVGRMPL